MASLHMVAARRTAFRKRSLRCVLFSVLLTSMLVLLTGCAPVTWESKLSGDDKIAYERILSASTDFYVPSSIRILSGSVVGDSLYCCIQADNRLGRTGLATYRIDRYGDSYDSSSYSCYSTDLDCDTINIALKEHFGLPAAAPQKKSIFSINKTGGMGMSIGWIIFIVVVVYLCINGILASHASDIAQDKGYDKQTWFHMCFWLGLISYIIISAMPDKAMREMLDKTNKLLEELLKDPKKDKQQSPAPKKQDDVGAYLPEL